ncbi:FUSC family protein [Methylorubrum aminovorans]
MVANEGRRGVDIITRLRRFARWLELRAVGLIPEYFDPAEGARAAFIIAVPLVLIAATGERGFGWIIFAAFWTCLADTGGPERTRRALLAGFVLLGTLTTFVASWLAGLSPEAALAAGPVLVVMTALLPIRWNASSLVATLLGVVAVVAVGYPRPAVEAAVLAGAFLCGSAWAFVIGILVWRTDRWLPTRQAVTAVYARLHDMASDLVHRRADKPHIGQTQHRRAVRGALERAHLRLARTQGDDAVGAVRLRKALLAADEVFHALLALEHLHPRLDRETKAMLEAIPPLLRASGGTLTSRGSEAAEAAEVARQAEALRQRVAGRRGAAAAAMRAMAAALAVPNDRSPEAALAREQASADASRRILQAAIRSGTGVGIVTLVAHWFALGYPYWAAMAVVVVLSPVRRISWSRAIERMVGSVVGGILAQMLLTLVSSSPLLVGIIVAATAATIAVRSVNYTLFVVFLTLLFVLTMGVLNPGHGIASARMLDNILGSFAAITATVLVWPERPASTAALAGAALTANRAYLDAVLSGDPALIATTRRAAGIASTEAEIAFYAPDRILGAAPTEADIADLMAARRLAGEAAALWYDRRAASDSPETDDPAPSTSSARTGA